MSFLLRFYFEMFIRGLMSISICHILLWCSFAFQLSFFSTQISWIFTHNLFFKDLKDDKTTFRKSQVSNRRYFFVQFSIMHNRTKWETRGSKVELCEIAHLFFSNSFGFSWTCWKVHKLYANEMNICFPSFHQNFCLSVHVLYAWDILFPCVTGRACLFTGMKMEMRHEMCSSCLTG